uniref:Uncharacterized protein n=1 Tax=Helianthus annuus TaxID=4232 RepID=A0A251VFW2_HELAN
MITSTDVIVSPTCGNFIPKFMRILRLHLIFAFPIKLRSTFRFPANLDQRNALAFKPLDFTFHDFHRFLNKFQCFINTNFVKRYVEVLIS